MHYNINAGVEVMPLLNGNMQAGDDTTSLAATGKILTAYSLTAGSSAVVAASRQSFTAGQTDVPGEPVYFLRATASAAGATDTTLQNRIEDVRTFAGRQSVIFQGFYKADQAVVVALRQNFGSGGSPSSETVAFDGAGAVTSAPIWVTGTAYTVGQHVESVGKIYRCITAGTSGSAPTTTAADITDNTVHWTYVRKAGIILPSTVDANGTAQWRPFTCKFDLPSISGKTIGSTANTSYLAAEFRLQLGIATQLDVAALALHVGSGRVPVVSWRRAETEQRLLARYLFAGTVPTGVAASGIVTLPVRMRVTPTVSPGSGCVSPVDTDFAKTILSGAFVLDARL